MTPHTLSKLHLLTLVFIIPLSLKAETYYVDAGAASAGNGSSWSTPFVDIQSALAGAQADDEIHVAEGTYYPDEGTGQVDDDRSSTFQLKSGVRILGGFRAGVGDLSERDPVLHLTILSGDIDQNDEGPFANNSGNAYHVVNGSGADHTAILDGFVITSGRADGSGSNRRGGGIYINDGSSPTVLNCTITANFAEIGGGLFVCLNSNPEITNCAFIGNRATFGGGLYSCSNSTPVLTNCVFLGNSGSGGAVSNDQDSSPVFVNCTFTGNQARRNGAAINNARGSSPQFINCIIWNNVENGSTETTGASVANDAESFPSFSYSLVANSGGSANWDAVLGTDNGNNIDADPLFILDADPFSAPTTEGNLQLQTGSPAINAGDNPADPTELDIEGNQRIQFLTIDLGAYESPFDPDALTIIYVDASATGQADGLSWGNAFTHLQDALQEDVVADSIHVAKGTYYPDEGSAQTDNDRLASFQLKPDTALLGGFPRGGGDLSERNPANHLTVLSGDIDQNDTAEFAGNSGNSFTVVNGAGVDATAVLDGFTITAGNANGTGLLQSRGGGMFCENGSPSVFNSTFRGNFGSVGGGFFNCTDSSPNLVNCLFLGNLSEFGGAMFNCIRSTPTLVNCAFQGNMSTYQGGAIYNDFNTSPIFINCTFSGNSAFNAGGALYNTRSSSPQFINCIIWNNVEDGSTETTGASVINNDDSAPVFSHSLVANSGGSASWNTALGIDDGNNVDVDPLFVLPSDPFKAPDIHGSLRLKTGSPAVDAGDNAPNLTDTDLAGVSRIENSTIDIGAYEGVFSARFATFHPGLDPSQDSNDNGLSNFQDYASGSDPSSRHDSAAAPELAYSGSSLLLTLSSRANVEDVLVTWQASESLKFDSWFSIQEGTDFEIDSTSIIGIRQLIVLELPGSPDTSLFYRQVLSEPPR